MPASSARDLRDTWSPVHGERLYGEGWGEERERSSSLRKEKLGVRVGSRIDNTPQKKYYQSKFRLFWKLRYYQDGTKSLVKSTVLMSIFGSLLEFQTKRKQRRRNLNHITIPREQEKRISDINNICGTACYAFTQLERKPGNWIWTREFENPQSANFDFKKVRSANSRVRKSLYGELASSIWIRELANSRPERTPELDV